MSRERVCLSDLLWTDNCVNLPLDVPPGWNCFHHWTISPQGVGGADHYCPVHLYRYEKNHLFTRMAKLWSCRHQWGKIKSSTRIYSKLRSVVLKCGLVLGKPFPCQPQMKFCLKYDPDLVQNNDFWFLSQSKICGFFCNIAISALALRQGGYSASILSDFWKESYWAGFFSQILGLHTPNKKGFLKTDFPIAEAWWGHALFLEKHCQFFPS